MDVRMPDMDGIAATAALVQRDPDRPRVLVLTTFEDDDYLYRALSAGASGFALKRRARRSSRTPSASWRAAPPWCSPSSLGASSPTAPAGRGCAAAPPCPS